LARSGDRAITPETSAKGEGWIGIYDRGCRRHGLERLSYLSLSPATDLANASATEPARALVILITNDEGPPEADDE
jgi:hypothetical protein